MDEKEHDESTRELIQKILNRKDPAIVGLKKILSAKDSMARPGQTLQRHSPEVFNVQINDEVNEKADDSDFLLIGEERLVAEYEAKIATLNEEIEKLQQTIEAEKEEAYQRGFQEGEEQALSTASEEYAQTLLSIREEQSRELASQIQQELEDREAHIFSIETSLTHCIVDIIETIIGNSDIMHEDILSFTLNKALKHLAGRTEITIKVHPALVPLIEERRDDLIRKNDSILSIRVEETSDMIAGGAIIETETGTIDASIETQIDEIKQIIIDSWQEYAQNPPTEDDLSYE